MAPSWPTSLTVAVFTTGTKKEHQTVWFFLGLGLTTYIAWFVGSLLGALIFASKLALASLPNINIMQLLTL